MLCDKCYGCQAQENKNFKAKEKCENFQNVLNENKEQEYTQQSIKSSFQEAHEAGNFM